MQMRPLCSTREITTLTWTFLRFAPPPTSTGLSIIICCSNLDKFEVYYFDMKQKLSRTSLPSSVNVAGVGQVGDAQWYTRRWFNFGTACRQHCQSLQFPLLGTLWHIRKSLRADVANKLECSIVFMSIDCCNSLLFGTVDSYNAFKTNLLVQSVVLQPMCIALSTCSICFTGCWYKTGLTSKLPYFATRHYSSIPATCSQHYIRM